jgi:hypothetical protein
LGTWEAIWYQVTPGQALTSDQTKFRVVAYPNSTWDPGVGWILIAARNGDTGTNGHVKWLPGQVNFPNSSGTYYFWYWIIFMVSRSSRCPRSLRVLLGHRVLLELKVLREDKELRELMVL